MLSATYAFVHGRSTDRRKLWPSVTRGLFWVQASLPLWSTSWRLEWARVAVASDSSGYGIGVCRRQISADQARAIGVVAEKLRYRFTEAIQARRHALRPGSPDGAPQLDPSEASGFTASELN